MSAPPAGRHPDSLPWEIGNIFRLFALAAAAGVSLAVFGPFGTYQSMPIAERLLFWELVLLCAAALHVPALWLADRVGRIARLPAPLWIAGAGLCAAAPTTLIVTGIMATLYGVARAPGFAAMYLFVVRISVPMQMLSYAVLRWSAAPPARVPARAAPMPPPVAPAPPPAEPRAEAAPVPPRRAVPLLDRLPAHLGGDIRCLEMQDHYVRVHTERGSTLLLMRLSDAEAELGDLPGERVHRSWWVAREAVIGTHRRGQSIALELAGGLTVPVSRAKLRDLRAAGWLDGPPIRFGSAAAPGA